jgi:hypothetical protein
MAAGLRWYSRSKNSLLKDGDRRTWSERGQAGDAEHGEERGEANPVLT